MPLLGLKPWFFTSTIALTTTASCLISLLSCPFIIDSPRNRKKDLIKYVLDHGISLLKTIWWDFLAEIRIKPEFLSLTNQVLYDLISNTSPSLFQAHWLFSIPQIWQATTLEHCTCYSTCQNVLPSFLAWLASSYNSGLSLNTVSSEFFDLK